MNFTHICFTTVDKEKEKEKFQSLMAYGKVVPPTPGRKSRLLPRKLLQTLDDRDRFAECELFSITNQIFLRMDGHN